jgi:hypothetical protein
LAELETPNRLLSALRYFMGAALPFIFLWVAIEKGFEGQRYPTSVAVRSESIVF